MKQISSRDGTCIATYCSGDGPPLVLVQGTGAARPNAWLAYPALEKRFRVYTFDRRGRGNSGDGPDYEVSCEFEDIAAVINAAANAVGESVNLMGHSYGGMLALEAALLTENVRKLVLYEPAIAPPGVVVFPDGFLDHLRALLAEGDREGALIFHYRSVGLSDDEIASLKDSPAWNARVAAASSIPRELKAVAQYRLESQRFQDLHIPTLLLQGGESPDFLTAGIKMVHAALPDSRVAIMPGQEHTAMYTGPDIFVEELQSFLFGA